MNHPGVTLRYIRKTKNMTLAELAKGEVSVAFLSRFERGDCDISFTHLLNLLNKLNVSMDEFLYVNNDYEITHFQKFFDDLKDYVREDNLHMLQVLRDRTKRIYIMEGKNYYLHFSIIAELYIRRISKKKPDLKMVKILSDYFSNVDVWGYYELVIYTNSMFSFPVDQIIALSHMAYEKSMDYNPLGKGDIKKQKILLNTIVALIENNRLPEANTFLILLDESLDKEKDAYMKIKLMFLKGIYAIKMGNRQRGEKMAAKAIKIFTDLGSASQASTHANYLQDVLNSTILKNNKHKFL
ncbi:helix-turn-helix domain-containing protein [Sporolactobacillus shoreicorticis]|uniref:Helix-turn-helix domain-containing protein n=1 Tax=Sporolactobacillus shoreicorticis TaxID=1923877 RepID=A0ABW5S7H5_9BACL|nr:Rgg/GadR/MutR family transcriptional regulator [Sporolactobacillus shoreicorticis]MCO7126678.1 helix-turn-helix domain-containing protein [Sporolactobacillus shoreicorticis]